MVRSQPRHSSTEWPRKLSKAPRPNEGVLNEIRGPSLRLKGGLDLRVGHEEQIVSKREHYLPQSLFVSASGRFDP